MKNVVKYFCFAILLTILASCNNNGNNIFNIGCKAENIYSKNDSSYQGYFETDTFLDNVTKCYMTATINNMSAQNVRRELYSPEGNLLMALGMCSECCVAVGYKFYYDSLGRTKSVSHVCLDDYDDEDMLQEMIRHYCNTDSATLNFEIGRDSIGRVNRIGNLTNLDAYDVEYGIYDGSSFWCSDIDGGDIYFVVILHVKEREMEYGTAVDLYYVNGKLAAEAAFWNGKFIKCLTYQRNGRVAAKYGNHKAPLDIILSEYCYGYDECLPWYCW